MSNIKYQGVIQLSNKNNAHTLAFNYVQALSNDNKLRILEVGCSTAYFGGELKNVGHIVWGIEPSTEPAKVAREKLDFVYEGFIEDFIDEYPEEKFNVIVFGDVLEHLPDPHKILIQCHNLLVQGGAIVASVPNVAHLTIRSMLFEGNWDYVDLGILDKTHLRFFTRHTIQKLFYEANYIVTDINPVTVPADAVAHMCKMGLNQEVARQINLITTDDTKEDFQYVLMAVPNQSADHANSGQYFLNLPKIKVLGLALNLDFAHADVRLMTPLRAWAELGTGEVRFHNFFNCPEELFIWADVIVLQRHVDEHTIRALKIAAHHKKKVIYESDDYLLNLPEHLAHHKASLAGYREHLDFILPQVDCVVATTNRLAHHQFKQFNRPTVVIPNCTINDILPPVEQNKWRNNQATLIIASSDSVLVDFIIPAILDILNNKDLDVSVVVIGPPGDAFDLAGVKCLRVPNLSYSEFKRFVRTIDNPIGVIPLDASIFSSCKTAIKYFDYTMAGIPVICSDVPPYSDVIQNKVHGILTENSTEAWSKSIIEFVCSIDLRKTIVFSAQHMVRQNFGKETAIREWDILLKDLVRNRYQYNPPVYRDAPKKVTISYLIIHLFNINSYKAAYRIFVIHGPKSLIKRFF